MAKTTTCDVPEVPYTNGFGYWFIMVKKARLAACVEKDNAV
tara:strand:- start:257 stop:379 length:123 start_codon:yes stop_codon:yes gene_type:complete